MKRHGQMPVGTPPRKRTGATWYIEDHGVAAYIEPFCVNTVDFLKFLPTYNSPHPTMPTLFRSKISGSDDVLGLTYYSVEWKGVIKSLSSQEPFPPPPTYFLNGVKVSASIDTHVKFNELVALAGGAGVGKAMFDENGKFLGFGKDSEDKSLVGGTTFDDGSLVWSVRFISLTSQRNRLSKFQLIDDPMGPYPKVRNRNWRLVDFSEESFGGVYDVGLSWEMSGDGGWHPVIYGPRT